MSDTMTSGRGFMNAAMGRWASERMLAALNERRPINASVLREGGVLQHEEWIHFDNVLVSEGIIRLKGIADLIALGLTRPVPNALGKTLIQYEKLTDMQPAEVSLDGLSRTDDDGLEFEEDSVPLPITHKDFNLNLRSLTASREKGEPLDTTHVRVAGRVVSERLEKTLFQGGPTYGGKVIYGYTNHPDRNTGGFSGGLPWGNASKTGAQYLTDVETIVKGLQADRFNGPYGIYHPPGASVGLGADFKVESDLTIKERLLKTEGVSFINAVDQIPADTVVGVQLTPDVVELFDGEGIQTVQWDLYGGFRVAFKAFAIQVPIIRSDAQGRSGVFHMS